MIAILLGIVIAAGVAVIAYDRIDEMSNRSDREKWPALLKERRRQWELGYYPDDPKRDLFMQERPGPEAAKAREDGMKLELRLRAIKRRNPDLEWNPSTY